MPRLWREVIDRPVIDSEPELTFGNGNTISWQVVDRVVEYYVVCWNDPNLEEVVGESGWIDVNEYSFEGLESGKEYWYAVKGRENCVVESEWSDVVSSLQGTVWDAFESMLDAESMNNANNINALMNKIDAVRAMIDRGQYKSAVSKLENDILVKMDGCALIGVPDENDWIISCKLQNEIYPLVIQMIEELE